MMTVLESRRSATTNVANHASQLMNFHSLDVGQDTSIIDGACHSKHDAIPNFLGLL